MITGTNSQQHADASKKAPSPCVDGYASPSLEYKSKQFFAGFGLGFSLGDSIVRLWDAATGAATQILDGPSSELRCHIFRVQLARRAETGARHSGSTSPATVCCAATARLLVLPLILHIYTLV